MVTLRSRVASTLILIALVTVAVGALIYFYRLNRPLLAAGDACPEFQLHTIDGSLLTRHDLRGKSAALLFLHPSCRLCKSTISQLCAARRETKNEVILVSLADAGSTQGYSKSVCLLGKWTLLETETAQRLFGIRSLPAMVAFQPDGKIAHVSVGANVRSDFSRYFLSHDETLKTER